MEKTNITLQPVSEALMKIRRQLVKLRKTATAEEKKSLTKKIARVDRILFVVRIPPCRAFSDI
jgi:hypothetical protein